MGSFPRDKMKNKEYNTIEKVAKSILSNTQIHNRSLIWLGTDTSIKKKGDPGGSMSQVVELPNTAWVRARLCKLQKGCTRLAAASDKVYQLLAHSRWFSPGTLASSTTKTGRHEIAEILLKVALNTINQIKSFNKKG